MEKKQEVLKPVNRLFLKENCEFNVAARTYHKTLYSAYKKWCVDNGWICTISTIDLSRTLGNIKEVIKARYVGGVIWYGIKLKDSPILDEVLDTFNKTRAKVVRTSRKKPLLREV